MRRAANGRRRGFTLIELMVVVGIIIIMTALAVPAISKFLDGQSLHQSGRILQSAFNECRRAAITQRAKNYLVFFREDDPTRPGEYRYGVQRYRERVGYEVDAQYLLAGVQFDLEEGSTTTGSLPTGAVTRIKGLGLPLFQPLPEETAAVFGGTDGGRMPVDEAGWIEFRRDGTLKYTDALLETNNKLPHVIPSTQDNLFDLNAIIELDQAGFDEIAGIGGDDTPKTDMNLRETGDRTVDKRCFVDIDPNTGRVNIRVVQVIESD